MESIYEENICVMCKTAQDSVDNLTNKSLLVNFVSDSSKKCGHKFCEACTKRQLGSKKQFTCPICGSIVKQSTLTKSSLDEIEVQTDAKVRKRLKEIYNKTEEDFPTLREFGDYEEMLEDLIYKLVHNIDKKDTEWQIDCYRRENAESILINKSKRAETEWQVSTRVEDEMREREERLRQFQEEDSQEAKELKELKRQKNQLMLGEIDQIRMPTSESTKKPLSKFMAAAAGTISAPHVQEIPSTVTLSAPNPVLIFLMQRPEPKPLGPAVNQGDKSVTRDQRYAAAGFDQTICLRRNWFEVVHCLTLFRNDTCTDNKFAESKGLVTAGESWPMTWEA